MVPGGALRQPSQARPPDGRPFGAEFRERHESTRGWSPFNYEVCVRANRGDSVVGIAFGHRVEITADGAVRREPIDHALRQEILSTELGYACALVDGVPPDRPTPPPPQSRTARGS